MTPLALSSATTYSITSSSALGDSGSAPRAHRASIAWEPKDSGLRSEGQVQQRFFDPNFNLRPLEGSNEATLKRVGSVF